jgi:hypothetical protein
MRGKVFENMVYKDYGLRFRVKRLEFRVRGLEFSVWGLEFRVSRWNLGSGFTI